MLNAAPAAKYFDHRHIGFEVSKSDMLAMHDLTCFCFVFRFQKNGS